MNTEIQDIFRFNPQESVLIMAVGNTLRSDDGIGPYILNKIKDCLSQLAKTGNIEFIDTGIVPENYIQKIIDLKRDKIIIFDAADFGGRPGELRLIPNDAIPESSISTHAISLRVIAKLVIEYSKTKVFFLGIQPKNIDFGEELSLDVQKQADIFINELCTKYMQ